MDKCFNSNATFHDQKVYNETVSYKSIENLHQNEEECGRNATSIIDTSFDVHEENVEEWQYSCIEKEIPVTVPCATMSEKYFSSKFVLSPGLKGSRPHFSSLCTFIIESMEFLPTSFLSVLNQSQFLATEKVNTDLNYEIGSYDTELDKALEVVLLDMFEGERCQVILHTSDRDKKLRDQEVNLIPYLKCTIHLIRIVYSTVSSNFQGNSLLSLIDLSEERKCSLALNEKARGVELFKKGQYVNAFHRFAWGCKVLLTVDSLLLDDNTEKSKDVLNLYSILCSNMAECQLKENNPTLAMSLCKKAIACDHGNVKALYRQAYASWTLGDVDQAHALLEQVLKLDPNNVAAKRLIGEVQVKIKKYSVDYSKMMKRIFQH